MEPDTRDWLRSLPLLLVGGVALIAGAMWFYKAQDNIASVAAMTLGVVLISMWAATCVGDWIMARRRAKGGDE
jgi:hypothetical protein